MSHSPDSDLRPGRRTIPGEQRVFSLILALVASPQGITKREILRVVYGYSDRYRVGQHDPSLERQFERDKSQLRELGIPVETIDSPLEPGNNQLTRYRIRKELLEVPASLRFSSDELSLLRLAAIAWAEGSLTAESRRSLMKLAALGAGLDVQHLGIAPRIGITEAAAPVLQQAIVEGADAVFEYRHPNYDEPLERTVLPLRLHRAEGRWHLIAYDLERKASRVFLLSRIAGRVRVRSAAASAERDELLTSAKSLADAVETQLRAITADQRAEIAVARGSRAEARLFGRRIEAESSAAAEGSDNRSLTIGTTDFRELAIELAGFGDELGVLAPDALREDVVSRLRAARAQHSDEHESAERLRDGESDGEHHG